MINETITMKKTDLLLKGYRNIRPWLLTTVIVAATGFCSLRAQKAKSITVNAAQVKGKVQPTMWGVFFEDINFGADGGLYAELVKNRSFEFDGPMMGWVEQNKGRFSVNNESGSTLVINRGIKDLSNPRFARVNVNADKGYGLTNEGFR